MRLIFFFLWAFMNSQAQAAPVEHRPSSGGIFLLFIVLSFLALLALYLKNKKDPELFKKILQKHKTNTSSLVIDEQKTTFSGDRFYILNVDGQKILCCVSKQGSMALQSLSKEVSS